MRFDDLFRGCSGSSPPDSTGDTLATCRRFALRVLILILLLAVSTLQGAFGGAQSVRLAATGSVTDPRTGKVVPPKMLVATAEGKHSLAVDSPDDLRATNPASHPSLLQALADDWTKHNHDVKHLLRTLCNSRVYQLASEVTPERDREGMFFTHRRPRRLPAEVLLDAINQAAGTTEKFDRLPHGLRAVSLPDPSVISYFLDVFGRPR